MAADIAILGAGAWGTALAVHLAARATRPCRVALHARDPVQARGLATARENVRYLPGVRLPDGVEVVAGIDAAAPCGLLVAATPVAALPELAAALRAAGARGTFAWLSKGFVAASGSPAGVGLAHQVIAPTWPGPCAVVSGPSFAEEVARGLPTALAVAATAPDVARAIADCLRGETLRCYDSDDIVGVETGGAIKNVLAIAAGASDGLGFGHNARAALITRGLAETARLSAALGGDPRTVTGLAGLGDLVLTCTGDLSRNRRVGLALARGERLADVLAALGHVAEGVAAARAAMALARLHGLDMPITEAVYRVLYEALPPRDAVLSLLRREPRSE